MAKFVCPYCMQRYNLKEVLYTCPEPGCNHVAPPGLFERKPIKCKNTGCTGLATQRNCPKCLNMIPQEALETPNLPFSIVGVSNSGKTNYITVMLHELSRTPGLRLSLRGLNKETRDHQSNNYRLIYEDHIPPESTTSGQKMPQIWCVKNNNRKNIFGNVPGYTFTIFDGAGEDHENHLDPSSTICRYIAISKAIIITLDPLILPGIRKEGIVPAEIMRNSLAGSESIPKDVVAIVHSIASYIKTARGIKGNKNLQIPVAVVLTKFDTILSHKSFGPNALIRNSSLNVNNGKINMGDMLQVDLEIRNWLSRIGEGAFIEALISNFKEFVFFGVSSYGEPPQNAGKLSYHIRPHRVLDPILWFFKKAGFVD